MNISIPHKWLLEHLDTQASPEKIQETLSLCGPSVERIDTIQDDQVYDIEVTTNRVDSASIRGIAREAATILPEFGINAKLKKQDLHNISESLVSLKPIDIDIQNDPTLCKRLMGIVMEVTVKESPQWLKTRLEQVGQRPLNNLIDITNYVMWELGHPTHVFDYDKFVQKKLIVREAKAGEQVITLDKKKYTTVGGEVVFDDGTGTIIDMPGLMGTDNTIVDENTTKVLFFIDSVIAEKIRFASMTHNIRTQAAVLNEKHVDPALGDQAMLRGIELFKQVAEATPLTQIYDNWPVKQDITPIKLSQKQIDTYLGVAIKPDRVQRILESLGCQVDTTDPKIYVVTPPTYRSTDLQIYQDLIEEIARIYGYHNLPSTLMATALPADDYQETFQAEHQIKQALADWGASEVMSYSLVSEELAKQSGYPLEAHVKLSNSLTEDLVYMRQSLVPSHAQIFENNKTQENWTIFEMANTYWQDTGLPKEKLELVISNNDSYKPVKKRVDQLAQLLNLPSYMIKPTEKSIGFIDERVALIEVSDQIVGYIGKTTVDTFSAVIDMTTLLDLSVSHTTYLPISNTSPIIEDMTFELPPETYLGMVLEHIKTTDAIIEAVNIKDIYKQNHTFTIKYADTDKQLTVDDVKPVRNKLQTSLKKSFGANLIGELQD